MKLTRWIPILILVPFILLAAGQEKSNTNQGVKRGRLTLPEGAEKIDAQTHRWTDENGKHWIYRLTPFGLVRYEDNSRPAGKAGSRSTSATPRSSSTAAAKTTAAASPAPAAQAEDTAPVPGLKAFDEGEMVRFERPGPFGKYTWRRKKDELTAQERLAWEAAQNEKSSANKTSQEQR